MPTVGEGQTHDLRQGSMAGEDSAVTLSWLANLPLLANVCAVISILLSLMKRRALTLSGQSGFVSSGHGMAPGEEGLIAIVVASLLGAFCGLLGGFILAHFCRFLTFLTGRYLGGFSWVIVGALAGAVIFGCLAAKDEG
jgi:hypothetical protein